MSRLLTVHGVHHHLIQTDKRLMYEYIHLKSNCKQKGVAVLGHEDSECNKTWDEHTITRWFLFHTIVHFTDTIYGNRRSYIPCVYNNVCKLTNDIT